MILNETHTGLISRKPGAVLLSSQTITSKLTGRIKLTQPRGHSRQDAIRSVSIFTSVLNCWRMTIMTNEQRVNLKFFSQTRQEGHLNIFKIFSEMLCRKRKLWMGREGKREWWRLIQKPDNRQNRRKRCASARDDPRWSTNHQSNDRWAVEHVQEPFELF